MARYAVNLLSQGTTEISADIQGKRESKGLAHNSFLPNAFLISHSYIAPYQITNLNRL